MPKVIKPSKKRPPAKELSKKAMKSAKGGSASLMQACCTGKHISESTITTR